MSPPAPAVPYPGGDVVPFVEYALRGFVDGLAAPRLPCDEFAELFAAIVEALGAGADSTR